MLSPEKDYKYPYFIIGDFSLKFSLFLDFLK